MAIFEPPGTNVIAVDLQHIADALSGSELDDALIERRSPRMVNVPGAEPVKPGVALPAAMTPSLATAPVTLP